MLFIQYDASGNITGRFTVTDSFQMVNYASTIATSIGLHDTAPELWGRVTSTTIMLQPASNSVAASVTVTGGAGFTVVNCVGWNPSSIGTIDDVRTPRLVASFMHRLTINDSREVGFRFVSRAGALISSLAFTSFNDTRLYSATVLSIVSSSTTAPVVQLSVAAGADLDISSRILIVRDSAEIRC